MDSVQKNPRAFVAKLARENREFYGTPDGRGLLNAIELTFQHRWVYLYELVQNALDVGASSIALRLAEDGDALIFQHNGDRSLDEKDVEGLSKVFRSTKGARSVGFMGIGFKSVFLRFQKVRISGWGWKFRYEIPQVVGEEYGDKQRDLLGSVIPIWDDAIMVPEPEYTTRFEMRRRTDEGVNLESDLARFLPDDNRTPLAILAISGLKRLEIAGCVWELGVSEERAGSLEATALSEGENRIWRAFPARFQPSTKAIACFLEHRSIQPSKEDRGQVYADAARARRVYGVLPLDNDGIPEPPTRGHVYATLPTEVTLPFALHINADWLLNISRSGLREIEDNPWQREIVDQIADILACVLKWSADAHTQPDAAKAAFKVLAQPSSESGDLESLLAEERWLSRFRDRIEDAAVFPVWTEKTATMAYAKADDTVVPPLPLAKAFRKQPELRPTVLLKGSVLKDDVLGPKALGLLRRVGFLTEISPRELERVWQGGLEDWWQALPGEQENRPRLLFRVWAAVAELTSDDKWQDSDLPCIRSVAGRWLPVREATFLNETLPVKSEPGGHETRRFVQPVIQDRNRLDSRWVTTLRQRRREDPERTLLSQAWGWIEDRARSVSLQEIIEDALNVLASSTNPDWSVLVPLGHWAKHRDRPKLLTRVLVESKSGLTHRPTGETLLADPYVGSDQGRRRLFPAVLAITAAYLEEDPQNASVHEWRSFFEKAGAKGILTVIVFESHVDRRNRADVAMFLGREIGSNITSNDSGYTLVDFDIEFDVPGQDASIEIRQYFANWLDDGSGFLKGTGRRKCSYSYYSKFTIPGNTLSIWATKLSERQWVPCSDGKFRCPQDVLPQVDLAREDAPVAQLSSTLVSVLEEEGVKFGSAIPEATSLRKLSTRGSQLNAEELARLLSECREQITSDTDRHLFDKALQNLELPSNNNQRVPLDRIVQRVGGRLRGALGGWIVPLNRIEETLRTELERPDFPRDFPETTTGDQALDYIRDVWARARFSPEGLANEVRDVLPIAYAYCLEDCAADVSISERWSAAAQNAMVFVEGEWIGLTEADDIYFDDIDDRRFIPSQVQLRTVTGGHLGRSRREQLLTAEAINLPLLTSSVTTKWSSGHESLPVSHDWTSRFKLIWELLRRARGSDGVEGDRMGVGSQTEPGLHHVKALILNVSIGNGATERVPVNARFHEGILTVAGRPIQFGADTAKELLRHFSFGQRADLAADLTGMLNAIEGVDFNLAADKFRRSHAPDFELPASFETSLDNGESNDSENNSDEIVQTTKSTTKAGTGTDVSKAQISTPDTSEPVETDPSGPSTTDGINTATSGRSGNEESDPMGGSYSKSRALATQNTLARQLKSLLKGEIVPDPEEDDAGQATATDGDTDNSLGDEEYREVAAQYERQAGREPHLGDPRQSGWDIRSIDPKTQQVRLIEVKGKGRPWTDDEVVELSRAQIRQAFEATDSWYLYVVEKTGDDCYQVLPIANPVRTAAKWILSGESWRMVAESAKPVSGPPN